MYIQRIFFTALFLLIPSMTFAASVFVNGAPDVPTEGTSIVSIRIDTEGSTINAIEGVVSLSGDAHIIDVRDASSIVGFWIEPLEIADGTVRLSGIIPGGFEGEGELISLVVSGNAPGSASLVVGPFTVFQDDGLGTEVQIESLSVSLAVVEESVGPTDSDDIPPEPFSVGVINVSGGGETPLYAAIFATNDRQTGIDRYEIQESDTGESRAELWHVAESPYVLIDQTRSGKIFVRAIDNAGNIRESEFRGEENQGMIQVFVGAVLLAILLFLFFYVRRHTPSKTKKR